MPKKEIVTVGSAAPNPNLSAATGFGNPVFVAGQTGREAELIRSLARSVINVLQQGMC